MEESFRGLRVRVHVALLNAAGFRMKWFSVMTVSVACFLACALHATTVQGGRNYARTITQGDISRTFTLFVPSDYQPNETAPLMFNFHGWGSTRARQMELTDMNAVAESEGFLVVYPQSDGASWNVFAEPDRADDLDLVTKILDEVALDFPFDATRVYTTGYSNGGSMAYFAAQSMPDKIAAVASAAGTMPEWDNAGHVSSVGVVSAPTTSRPLPVMHVHGTSDQTVRYRGGVSGNSGYRYPDVERVLSAWAENNGCNADPLETPLFDADPTDRSTVVRFDYSDCSTYLTADGAVRTAELVHLRINSGGHVWPSDGSWPAGLGVVNHDINTSREMWRFLSNHTLPVPEPSSATLMVCGLLSGLLMRRR